MLSLNNISMRYGARILFEDVTTTFQTGRRYAVTGLLHRQAKIGPGGAIARLGRGGYLEMRNGLLVLARRSEGLAKLRVVSPVARINRDRGLKLRQRGRGVLREPIGCAQVIVSQTQLGVELNRSLEMRNRFVAPIQYCQKEPNLVLIDRGLGIESGSFLIGGQRSLGVSLRFQGSGPRLDTLQLVGVTGRLAVNRRATGKRRFAGCQ